MWWLTMLKLKYALESEVKYCDVDEREYQKRRMLHNCLNYKMRGIDKETGESLLLEEQQEELEKYFNYLLANKNGNKGSAYTIYYNIEHVAFLGRYVKKPFIEMTRDDLISYFRHCQMPDNGKKGIKTLTLQTRQLGLRKFFRWLHNDRDADIISWMKVTIKPNNDMDKSKVLTPEEVKRMISCCSNKRDACMVIIAYECGLRAGELVGIRLKDIIYDDKGFKIKVEGKTGKRTAFVIDSEPYLRELLNDHPYKENLEAPLFINYKQHGRQLVPRAFSNIVKEVSKRAGINKRVYPHLLRHSMLNHLGKNGFKERDLRIFAGWTLDSKMPDVYLHYDEEEVEKKLRKFKGIIDEDEDKKEEIENKTFAPKVCSRCKQQNPATAKYCNCGMALDLKTVIEDTEKRERADNVMNELFQDSEFRDIVKQFLAKKVN